ncbi:hypothetical protein ISN44_As10g008780 [Arabidopsis suecica]|uniref:Uncharacterized protein n=1 Tax=Arabidopsis suecica TaxID=45249 RepID=A0A8T1ZXB1_ARASU|nr:hypothetical protein ISN44_As10g008780 [Arabidopsis suecica]
MDIIEVGIIAEEARSGLISGRGPRSKSRQVQKKKKKSLHLFDPAFGPSASPHADDFELSHAGDYELVP